MHNNTVDRIIYTQDKFMDDLSYCNLSRPDLTQPNLT